jgi:hypothetical protein
MPFQGLPVEKTLQFPAVSDWSKLSILYAFGANVASERNAC